MANQASGKIRNLDEFARLPVKKITFTSLNYTAKKWRAKREHFLDKMKAAALEAVIEPCYPKTGKRGR